MSPQYEEHPIATVVREHYASKVFFVSCRWRDDDGHEIERCGTCFPIGLLEHSNRFVCATAGHVVRTPEDRPVTWRVEGRASTGELERVCTFVAENPSDAEHPIRFHRHIDNGALWLPRLADDGTPFRRDAEGPINVICDHLMSAEGATIVWAGYPGHVAKFLGRPQLCYFQGIISACVNAPERPLYLVDGHAAHGVSGAPVFSWDDATQGARAIGIVSQYHFRGEDPGVPGYCVFEPLNPLMLFMKNSYPARRQL